MGKLQPNENASLIKKKKSLFMQILYYNQTYYTFILQTENMLNDIKVLWVLLKY